MGVAGMRWNPSRRAVGGAVLEDDRAAAIEDMSADFADE